MEKLPKRHDKSVDSFKGILILLIVLGHNPFFSSILPSGYSFLYKFHVACFLILPFVFPINNPTTQTTRDRLIRYLAPHFVFFLSVAYLNFLINVPKNYGAIVDWATNTVLAGFISTQYFFKQSTGFYLFWFLPALSVSTVLRILYLRLNYGYQKILLMFICAGHMFVGLIPITIKNYIPCSFTLVIFLFPFGLFASAIYRYKHLVIFKLFFICVFILSIYLDSLLEGNMAIAGEERTYVITMPYHFIMQDLFIISAFFSILTLSSLIHNRFLCAIGRNSLIVFLSHSLVQQVIIRFCVPGEFFDAWVSPWYVVAYTFVGTVLGSYACAYLINSSEILKRFILPKDWNSWRGAIPFLIRGFRST